MIIRTENGTGHTRVSLLGRFDAHEIAGFARSVDPLVTAESPDITLNLVNVAFVDSSALAELVRLRKATGALGGTLRLEDISDPVRVILEITNLLDVFDIVRSEAPPAL